MSATYQTHLRVDIPVMRTNCIYRALAHATGKGYNECAAHLNAVASRQNCETVRGYLFSDMCKALASWGLTAPIIFGKTLVARACYNATKARGEPVKTTKGCTLKTLLESGVVARGRYIVAVPGHAFALIDGQIYDHGRALRQNIRIGAIWKAS